MLWWFCSLSNLHLQVLTERRFFAASTSECSIAEPSRCRGRADLLHQQTGALCQRRATSAICVKALLTAAVVCPLDIENPDRTRNHLCCLASTVTVAAGLLVLSTTTRHRRTNVGRSWLRRPPGLARGVSVGNGRVNCDRAPCAILKLGAGHSCSSNRISASHSLKPLEGRAGSLRRPPKLF
jgi:hypothetical protein